MYSLSQLPLSTATIIFFTNPLFVTLLAPWLLRERVTWRRAITVSIGFAGAILVVDPGRAGFQWILLGPLMVALMSALRELVVRAALARETSVSLLFYSTTSVTVIAAFTLFLDDHAVWLEATRAARVVRPGLNWISVLSGYLLDDGRFAFR